MESIITHDKVVMCDGKERDKNATVNNNIGHPKVYLHVQSKDVVNCPYCNRSFVFRANSK